MTVSKIYAKTDDVQDWAPLEIGMNVITGSITLIAMFALADLNSVKNKLSSSELIWQTWNKFAGQSCRRESNSRTCPKTLTDGIGPSARYLRYVYINQIVNQETSNLVTLAHLL